MSAYIVLFDANVLYPAPMRDLLLQLAVTDIFRARWTADIHREWIDALLLNQPCRDRAVLERTRDKMDTATRDCGDLLSQPDTVTLASRSRRPTYSRRRHRWALRRHRDPKSAGLPG